MLPLSISQARNKLTQLAGKLNAENDAVEVTSRGKPVLAILPWHLYEALEETVEILGDQDLQRRLRQGIDQMQQGNLIPWNQVRKKLGFE